VQARLSADGGGDETTQLAVAAAAAAAILNSGEVPASDIVTPAPSKVMRLLPLPPPHSSNASFRAAASSPQPLPQPQPQLDPPQQAVAHERCELAGACGLSLPCGAARDDEGDDELVGRTVEKHFAGFGLFRGTVTRRKLLHRGGGSGAPGADAAARWYHVRYTDGDSEDLAETTVRELLLAQGGGGAGERRSSAQAGGQQKRVPSLAECVECARVAVAASAESAFGDSVSKAVHADAAPTAVGLLKQQAARISEQARAVSTPAPAPAPAEEAVDQVVEQETKQDASQEAEVGARREQAEQAEEKEAEARAWQQHLEASRIAKAIRAAEQERERVAAAAAQLHSEQAAAKQAKMDAEAKAERAAIEMQAAAEEKAAADAQAKSDAEAAKRVAAEMQAAAEEKAAADLDSAAQLTERREFEAGRQLRERAATALAKLRAASKLAVAQAGEAVCEVAPPADDDVDNDAAAAGGLSASAHDVTAPCSPSGFISDSFGDNTLDCSGPGEEEEGGAEPRQPLQAPQTPLSGIARRRYRSSSKKATPPLSSALCSRSYDAGSPWCSGAEPSILESSMQVLQSDDEATPKPMRRRPRRPRPRIMSGAPPLATRSPLPPRTPVGAARPRETIEVIGLLAEGTFGDVMLVEKRGAPREGLTREQQTPAHLPKSAPMFVLKKLEHARAAQLYRSDSLQRQVNMLRACAQSAFVARLHEVLPTERGMDLLLEHVEGGDLWQVLYEDQPHGGTTGLREQAAAFYAGNVVLALEHVHSRGIAFRNIKPENLVLGADGYLKLVGFAFATSIPSGKRSYTKCGTLEYLAPEMMLSKGHDKAVDLWALGVLVYELLSGTTPFETDEGGELEASHRIVNSARFLRFPA
jgi:chemotaxis protein histidine kinase CheA